MRANLSLKKSIAVTGCLLSLSASIFAAELGGGKPESLGFSSKELAKIDVEMQQYIDDNRLGDIEVLIAKKGKVVYTQSFSRDKSKNKSQSLYRIASMTKPITSVAIMQLVERGQLSLEDPISRYVPEFKKPKVLVINEVDNANSKMDQSKGDYHLVNSRREITVKDLLTHTSGIIYGFTKVKHLSKMYFDNGVSDGLTTSSGFIGDNVKKLAKLPLKHQPGKHFTYGLSTDVLGFLVEAISKQSLDSYFKKNIFQPLQMNDTHFYLSKEKFERLVPLYTPAKGGGIRVIDEEKDKSNLLTRFKDTGKESYYSGGAGLVSTANDYAIFLQMLLNKGEYEKIRILQPKTVDLMFENHIKDIEQGKKNYRFGLGFMISNEPDEKNFIPKDSLSWGGIFHTKFWIDPTNEIVAVSMAQKFPAPKSDVHIRFKKMVYKALIDQ